MPRPLREIVEENGWSLKSLAEQTGAAQSTLGNFFKGQTRAGDELLKKLGTFFKIEPDEIENPQPKEGRRLHYEAREDEIDVEEWRLRALRAEEKLALLRAAFRAVLEPEPRQAPQPKRKISATEAAASELLDEAEKQEGDL